MYFSSFLIILEWFDQESLALDQEILALDHEILALDHEILTRNKGKPKKTEENRGKPTKNLSVRYFSIIFNYFS